MNPAMVLVETSKPTSNARRKTGFKQWDFIADEVLVTACPSKLLSSKLTQVKHQYSSRFLPYPLKSFDLP
ncbi:MAG: hypothetical protein ACLP2Y_12540 [Limisphaerales bacterium]